MKKLIKWSSLLMMLSVITSKKANAQSHRFVGIDHVGMNVPDMDSAVQFFTDVMGCIPVTAMGHLQLDAAWKKRYKIHSLAEVEKIVSLRAGNGANIELFQYNSPQANKEQPYNDDMGLNHIAFYTIDIAQSVAYLKTKGVSILNDPIKNTAGPTAGETWVYFLTPWGAKIELISYPDGKAYEKANPAVKLWSPKDSKVSQEDLNPKEVNQLVTEHLEIWNEKDTARRTEAIKKVYNSQVNVAVPGFEFTGYTKLNGFIDDLQSKNEGYVFTHQRPVESHHNLARLFWSFGPPSNPDAITGMDLFIIEDGKVQSLYVFLDTK